MSHLTNLAHVVQSMQLHWNHINKSPIWQLIQKFLTYSKIEQFVYKYELLVPFHKTMGLKLVSAMSMQNDTGIAYHATNDINQDDSKGIGSATQITGPPPPPWPWRCGRKARTTFCVNWGLEYQCQGNIWLWASDAWYTHRCKFDVFALSDPKTYPSELKLTSVIPKWKEPWTSVCTKFQAYSLKRFWVMLLKRNLTFVTLKIKITAPKW